MNIFTFELLAAIAPGNILKLLDGFFVFLYLGPETIMPLASILATIVGALLIFWRLIVGFIKRLIRIIRRMPEEPAAENNQAAALETSSEEPKIQ